MTTQSRIQELVEIELRSGGSFTNWHGIAPDRVRRFLVSPYPVFVDPDDNESGPREMWVVLHELGGESPRERPGYTVVYDPQDESWGVAERLSLKSYVLVVGGDSLADALDGM